MILSRCEAVGQEDQTAAAADELPGEEPRDGQMRPEADQLGHIYAPEENWDYLTSFVNEQVLGQEKLALSFKSAFSYT